MGLGARALGLGATAATPAGLGTRAVGWLHAARRTLAATAWLGATDAELLGLLGGAAVGSVLPAVGFLAVWDVGSATGPALTSRPQGNRRTSQSGERASPRHAKLLANGQRPPVCHDAVGPRRLVVLRPRTGPHTRDEELHVIDVALQ